METKRYVLATGLAVLAGCATTIDRPVSQARQDNDRFALMRFGTNIGIADVSSTPSIRTERGQTIIGTPLDIPTNLASKAQPLISVAKATTSPITSLENAVVQRSMAQQAPLAASAITQPSLESRAEPAAVASTTPPYTVPPPIESPLPLPTAHKQPAQPYQPTLLTSIVDFFKRIFYGTAPQSPELAQQSAPRPSSPPQQPKKEEPQPKPERQKPRMPLETALAWQYNLPSGVEIKQGYMLQAVRGTAPSHVYRIDEIARKVVLHTPSGTLPDAQQHSFSFNEWKDYLSNPNHKIRYLTTCDVARKSLCQEEAEEAMVTTANFSELEKKLENKLAALEKQRKAAASRPQPILTARQGEPSLGTAYTQERSLPEPVQVVIHRHRLPEIEKLPSHSLQEPAREIYARLDPPNAGVGTSEPSPQAPPANAVVAGAMKIPTGVRTDVRKEPEERSGRAPTYSTLAPQISEHSSNQIAQHNVLPKTPAIPSPQYAQPTLGACPEKDKYVAVQFVIKKSDGMLKTIGGNGDVLLPFSLFEKTAPSIPNYALFMDALNKSSGWVKHDPGNALYKIIQNQVDVRSMIRKAIDENLRASSQASGFSTFAPGPQNQYKGVCRIKA